MQFTLQLLARNITQFHCPSQIPWCVYDIRGYCTLNILSTIHARRTLTNKHQTGPQKTYTLTVLHTTTAVLPIYWVQLQSTYLCISPHRDEYFPIPCLHIHHLQCASSHVSPIQLLVDPIPAYVFCKHNQQKHYQYRTIRTEAVIRQYQHRIRTCTYAGC